MDKNFLNDFPILRSQMNRHPLAYPDNSAITQKPDSFVRSICGYYGDCNTNSHHGVYELSVNATKVYEDARIKVAKFLNAKTQEIIFTKNATKSLNLVVYSYDLNNLRDYELEELNETATLKNISTMSYSRQVCNSSLLHTRHEDKKIWR